MVAILKIGCCCCYAVYAYKAVLRQAIFPNPPDDLSFDTALRDTIQQKALMMAIKKNITVVQRAPYTAYGNCLLPGRAGISISSENFDKKSPEEDARKLQIVHRLIHIKNNDFLWGYVLPLIAAVAMTVFSRNFTEWAHWGLGVATGFITFVALWRRIERRTEMQAFQLCGERVVRNALLVLKGQFQPAIILNHNPSFQDIGWLIGLKCKRILKCLDPNQW
ncbi:MAG TPA: hypothetical protein VMR37_08600, partial [Rhabdochlamydiaceae bacterium]|nr:hypothetical protein [Rhabdochlamydiaceae bacterium]